MINTTWQFEFLSSTHVEPPLTDGSGYFSNTQIQIQNTKYTNTQIQIQNTQIHKYTIKKKKIQNTQILKTELTRLPEGLEGK